MGSGVGRGGGYLAGVQAGGRDLPPRANAVLALLTPALLAALVVTGPSARAAPDDRRKALGVGWRRYAEAPVLLAVVLTALARLFLG